MRRRRGRRSAFCSTPMRFAALTTSAGSNRFSAARAEPVHFLPLVQTHTHAHAHAHTRTHTHTHTCIQTHTHIITPIVILTLTERQAAIHMFTHYWPQAIASYSMLEFVEGTGKAERGREDAYCCCRTKREKGMRKERKRDGAIDKMILGRGRVNAAYSSNM